MVPSADEPNALTHIGARGEARMVDVSDKEATSRVAIAEGRVRMAASTLAAILAGDAKKGDVIGAARIAGIMAAKKTADLIPLCHPLSLSKVLGRHRARRRPARPHRAGRGAMRRADRRRDGGADRRLRRLPHDLRHGQGDRPGHEHRGGAADRETRRQIGRMAGRAGSARRSADERHDHGRGGAGPRAGVRRGAFGGRKGRPRSRLRPRAGARHQGAQDPAAVRQLGHGRLCRARRRYGSTRPRP